MTSEVRDEQQQRKQVYFSDELPKTGPGKSNRGPQTQTSFSGQRSTQVIGSIHAQRLNYPKDQVVFHATDVPGRAVYAHSEMKQLIDPDTLGLRKKEWNTSVFKEQPIRDQALTTGTDLKNTLLLIKSGLTDEKTIDFKEKKIDPGVDTRNDYTGWNVSTEAEPMKHKTMRTFEENKELLEHTKAKADKLLKTREEKKKDTYKGPLAKQKVLSEQRRKQKDIEEELMNKAIGQVQHENPGASHSKVVALARKKVEEIVDRSKPLDKDCTFQPDLKLTSGGEKPKRRWNLVSF